MPSTTEEIATFTTKQAADVFAENFFIAGNVMKMSHGWAVIIFQGGAVWGAMPDGIHMKEIPDW